ncbi:DUF4265 domain-containing protein [Frankia gtarii]|uniref:DUF4265 domain-containing protein n=1 Tax=Frankia gtarii TaxID=2950102 RepID=UPI0021BE6777|nr:DUF4265 domain-containing protein [Frankia gtarii]
MTSSGISSDTSGEESASFGREGTLESKPERLYKVAFDLPNETATWAHASAERLWTRKTSAKMEVEVRNAPFYVKGIAFGDIVRVRADHDRRELVFENFLTESGHSTVRIILKNGDARDMVDAMIRSFDCSWEIDTTGYLWAIDVPPEVDYGSMRAALLGVAVQGKIGIEEAALSRSHRDRAGFLESNS